MVENHENNRFSLRTIRLVLFFLLALLGIGRDIRFHRDRLRAGRMTEVTS